MALLVPGNASGSKKESVCVGLPSLNLKRWYDSDEDDILQEFYIPALSESVRYRRLAGFFSSTSLAVAAKGICQLIKNKGKIELVTSPKFQEADIEAIREVYARPEDIAERIMLDELNDMMDEFVSDHVRAFGWMLANNLLTIKVAILYDEDSSPMDELSISKRGLFHQKVGILEDSQGNKLSFSGSENESAAGWHSNVEEFKVFRSWVEHEKEYLAADEKKFDKFWLGQPNKTIIIDLPKAVKRKLLEIAPSDIDELCIERWYVPGEPKKKTIVLRDYQKEAVNNWFLHGMKGIFEMATGTGKTYAALGCLRALWNREDQLLTVIACPYNHLITQWIRAKEEFGIQVNYMVADATNPHWRNQLADKILDLENGLYNRVIVFTTHDTFANADFRKLIQSCSNPSFLIVDEVHGVGAPVLRQGLLEAYRYRLGLSATPKRWFDLEGTEVLFNYFGDTVYEFPLRKAIGEFLTEYEYHPHFVTLTDDELNRYEQETEKIMKAYYSSKDDREKEEWYTLLCIRRQNIVKTAFNKYQVLHKILENNKDLSHCLVYCAPEQLNKVQDILLEHNIKQHKFTEVERTQPRDEYGGMSERDYLLKQLSQGILQSLVAIRCLDEGVDIPPARFAIMMCNSGNPREYVQRTGRILRKYPGKKIAIIHDIIVVPSSESLSGSTYSELERKIFSKELRRYKEFCYTARNSTSCLAQVERLEEKYGMFGGVVCHNN